MEQDLAAYKKARTLDEVDNAVRFDIPITADHDFFTDFSKVGEIHTTLGNLDKALLFFKKCGFHNYLFLGCSENTWSIFQSILFIKYQVL